MRVYRAIGLMSGTSMDGVDVAVIDTDGERIASRGPSALYPHRAEDIAILRRAAEEARAHPAPSMRSGLSGRAEQIVTRAHLDAVQAFLAQHGISPASIDVIGFHGQTILHRPDRGLTIQLGDGQALADALGTTVVFDFRASDVSAGGQGAPLVPVYHRALAAGLSRSRPLAVLNIGGVANITFIGQDGAVIACDTGPGNALLDDFVRSRTGARCDTDGALAARGQADQSLIDDVLARPFFALPPPKSLDRDDFAGLHLSGYSVPDGAATLTALTAACVARIIPHLPSLPETWIVAGGGARNATLMRMLAAALRPAEVQSAAQAGWSIDSLEAEAFGFLAVRSLRGLPLTFPGTTGVPQPLCGGVVVHPQPRAALAR